MFSLIWKLKCPRVNPFTSAGAYLWGIWKWLEMDGEARHPKLRFQSLESKAFIYFIIYSRGGEWGGGHTGARFVSVARHCVTSPRRGGGRGRLRWLPRHPTWLLGNRRAAPPPNESLPTAHWFFWSFDIFLVASISLLVFSSMSQRQKCLNNWGEISIDCQTAVFKHWLSARHTECREPVRWQIIPFFFSLNRGNHIPIPWLLLANQNMLCKKEKISLYPFLQFLLC